MNIYTFAESTINLFLEYRDRHGYSVERAKEAALLDMTDPYVGLELEEKEVKQCPEQSQAL